MSPILCKEKGGLTPGLQYRVMWRTWCNPNGGPYRSAQWDGPVIWDQPSSIRVEGGTAINNLDVYPNPSRDIFNVNFTSEDVQNLEVRVLNIVGEVVYTENLQQFVSAAGGLPRLENAPESEITGFDANVRYANDGGFYLQAGVSMLDTEVTKSGDSSFVEGAELAMAPEVSFNLLASQDVQLQSGNMLNLTANISHTGDQVKSTAVSGNANVVDQLTQEAYTLVNANLSYRFGNADQYALSLYGRNLTDEHYCGHILINDGNAILAGPNPKSGKKDTNQSVLCRVTNASTRTFGASISIDF